MLTLILLSLVALNLHESQAFINNVSPEDRLICCEQNNVTEAEFLEVRWAKGRPSDAILCTAKCFMERSGSLDSDGAINAPVARNVFKPGVKEHVKQMAGYCFVTLNLTITECEDIETYRRCTFGKDEQNEQ